MKAFVVLLKLAAGVFAAMLLVSCASQSNSPAPASASAARPVESPLAPAVRELAKGLTGAQVRALLGAPPATKPISVGGVNGLIWSYPFRTVTEVQPVQVTTTEVPAVNPLTGANTTRTEPVFQDETKQITDTLHLLLVDDRLVEWRIVRNEKNQYQ